jgi:hypothetical protein
MYPLLRAPNLSPSRNRLIHNGATNGTCSARFDAEGVPPRRFCVLVAVSDRLLATANSREFIPRYLGE